MNFAAVLAQLNDVPATFRPNGNPFAQWITSEASALSIFTNGADAEMAQVQSFSAAIDGWIDVWGLLFGVPRNTGEGNIPYATRVVETINAWVGTLPAIQAWIALFAPGGSVAENTGTLGYVITLPAAMTSAQVIAFLQSLGRIRPAGVPFTVKQAGLGLYLNSEAFIGKGTVFGSYLTGTTTPATLGLDATTCSSQPLIPGLLLSDPNLNPGTSNWSGFSVNNPYIPGTVAPVTQGTVP